MLTRNYYFKATLHFKKFRNISSFLVILLDFTQVLWIGKISSMNQVSFHPIGLIHSPFQATKGMPIQPASARGYRGHIEVFQEYAEGLRDIEGFSHIVLLYHFHLSDGYKLEVKPFVPEFDASEGITTGWLRNRNQSIIYPANDGRFDTKVINEK